MTKRRGLLPESENSLSEDLSQTWDEITRRPNALDTSGLPEHHRVWMENNPKFSRKWFEDRLDDGFNVHHIDSDHSNNLPDNLVFLCEHDHLRLHGKTPRNVIGEALR